MRVIDIMGELLLACGIRRPNSIARSPTCIISFSAGSAEAKINDDAAPLREALELLEYERQTWQLVCERWNRRALERFRRCRKLRLH